MKTIKQIADELGVDKQRVYRYIKKHHINEAHQNDGVMYYDEAAEIRIKQNFSANTTSSEAHHDVHQSTSHDTVIDTVISMLQRELEVKNQLIKEQQETIRELTAAINQQAESINAAQHNALAETIIDTKSIAAGSDEPPSKEGTKKRFWGFWKK